MSSSKNRSSDQQWEIREHSWDQTNFWVVRRGAKTDLADHLEHVALAVLAEPVYRGAVRNLTE